MALHSAIFLAQLLVCELVDFVQRPLKHSLVIRALHLQFRLGRVFSVLFQLLLYCRGLQFVFVQAQGSGTVFEGSFEIEFLVQVLGLHRTAHSEVRAGRVRPIRFSRGPQYDALLQ